MTHHNFSRRSFVQQSLKVGAAAVLSPQWLAHAMGSDVIKVGLVGCGGRGTGAGIIDCAESSPGIQLTAMGDLF